MDVERPFLPQHSLAAEDEFLGRTGEDNGQWNEEVNLDRPFCRKFTEKTSRGTEREQIGQDSGLAIVDTGLMTTKRGGGLDKELE